MNRIAPMSWVEVVVGMALWCLLVPILLFMGILAYCLEADS